MIGLFKSGKKRKCRGGSSARVVDGKLILSFPGAVTPVVWQMDLTDAKASALEVQQDKGKHTLILKTRRGEMTEVAPFEERDHAVDALMSVSRALENAQGHIRPVTVGGAGDGAGGGAGSVVMASSPRSKGKWLPVVLVLLFLFVLFVVWTSLIPNPAYLEGSSSATSGSSMGTGQGEAGVPLSADEYLRMQ